MIKLLGLFVESNVFSVYAERLYCVGNCVLQSRFWIVGSPLNYSLNQLLSLTAVVDYVDLKSFCLFSQAISLVAFSLRKLLLKTFNLRQHFSILRAELIQNKFQFMLKLKILPNLKTTRSLLLGAYRTIRT